MAKCDLCKKWGKTVYDPNIILGRKVFKIWVSACKPCITRYDEQLGLSNKEDGE